MSASASYNTDSGVFSPASLTTMGAGIAGLAGASGAGAATGAAGGGGATGAGGGGAGGGAAGGAAGSQAATRIPTAAIHFNERPRPIDFSCVIRFLLTSTDLPDPQ